MKKQLFVSKQHVADYELETKDVVAIGMMMPLQVAFVKTSSSNNR